MDAQFTNIRALPQAQRTQAYVSLAVSALGSPSTAASSVNQIVVAVVQESLVVARQALSDLAGEVGKVSDRDVRREIIENSLRELQPRVVSFEEAVSFLSFSRALFRGLIRFLLFWTGCELQGTACGSLRGGGGLARSC
jgi:COP9 signalosome complex subunit 4